MHGRAQSCDFIFQIAVATEFATGMVEPSQTCSDGTERSSPSCVDL